MFSFALIVLAQSLFPPTVELRVSFGLRVDGVRNWPSVEARVFVINTFLHCSVHIFSVAERSYLKNKKNWGVGGVGVILLSQWEFSHGKFGSLSLRKAQLRQSRSTKP